MIHSSHDIEQLLERYYDGLSTPDEEFVLYLALLQEEPGSPYYADRMLLEATLQRAATQTKSSETEPSLSYQTTPRWKVWVRKYAAVAAVLIVGGVGVSVFQWGRNSRQAELSLRNGQPITQEEVNEYTLAALTKLGDCVQLCSEQNEEIDQLFGRLQDSYQSSMEKIPFVSEGGWTLTGD